MNSAQCLSADPSEAGARHRSQGGNLPYLTFARRILDFDTIRSMRKRVGNNKMAASWGRRFLLQLQTANRRYQHSYFMQRQKRFRYPSKIVVCGCVAASITTLYLYKKYQRALKQANSSTATAVLLNTQEEEGDIPKNAIQNQRELRFLNFASVEYEGSIYMTPQDFLESVTKDNPRPRIGRARLHKEDVDRYLKKTPPKWKGTDHMFRNLHDKGVISYTEYLFLLCVLTKPHSGFRIAFNMFDTDGDERVDKREFLVLMDLFQHQFENKQVAETSSQVERYAYNIWDMLDTSSLEKILTKSAESDTPATKILNAEKAAGHAIDTTLVVHFFGRKGREVLTYEDFARFMQNLQTEVLELEFNQYSKGMPTIAEEDFARILLRYTTLTPQDHQDYLDRLRERVPTVQGIRFKEFHDFCRFLNNLDDFAIAMRIYTMGDQPVSEDEFRRAVKLCTGEELDRHLIHTVFQIFDIDGDGQLSHKEFISIMKDRLHRGFKTSSTGESQWDAFKACVKHEMKHS